MYETLPSCSVFAFALWRMGHRPILVPRQRLLNTWGGEMSRKMPGNKHPPFCPLAPRCPWWVSAPPDVPHGSVLPSECFDAQRKKYRLSPVPATSFSEVGGQVLGVVTAGLSSALRLCSLAVILSSPLTGAILRAYRMVLDLGNTKWHHKFWTFKYSTLEGWFSSLGIPFHLVL